MSINNFTPKIKVKELVKLLGLNKVPINLNLICSNLNIEIKYKDFNDVQAIFMLKNGKKKIIINKNVKYPSKIRFSIAHELGHYFIPGHKYIYTCKAEDIESFQSNNKEEKEADIFAVELLMPDEIFNDDVKKTPLDLRTFKDLSEKYHTSLLSTAIKYIKNTQESGAICYSENNEINWVVSSEPFDYYIFKGKLHESSLASDTFSDMKLIETPQLVPGYAWLEEDNVELIEHSIYFKNIGGVFTLLKEKDYY